MTVTLKFQSSGMMPGDARPVPMRGGSLTVGRGPANDLVLPDPDKMLSKSHFVIEDHNGNVVIVDLSTNGTFLNYSKIPLGRTPTPLNDGDVLSVGGYEMLIEIAGEDEADFLPGPADPAGVSHGSAEDAPDPMKLLDDSGPEGDFLDDLLGSEGGPKGPGQIATEDPMDALLPPLGDDDSDPLAPPAPEESGADSRLLHGGSMQDSYHTPQSPSGGGANLIPDDWDPFAEEAEDDLSAPPPQPPAQPAPPAPAASPIPEETQAPSPATP
ncbi:FHA domain-containing protein, partial [Aquicoccus sp. SCR17]|nr:FHA domain-containing protein [Carideicomes alvinocaridis]